jgi:ABC-2 type transport system permease protein
VRGVLLKGNSPAMLFHHIWQLLLFIVVVLGVGLKTFRRTLD